MVIQTTHCIEEGGKVAPLGEELVALLDCLDEIRWHRLVCFTQLSGAAFRQRVQHVDTGFLLLELVDRHVFTGGKEFERSAQSGESVGGHVCARLRRVVGRRLVQLAPGSLDDKLIINL